MAPATDPLQPPRARTQRGDRLLALTGGFLSLWMLVSAGLSWYWPELPGVNISFAMAISGLVGFGTNWVAIKMLFHPRMKLLGVQGVIPARRVDLARSVAATLEEHLISAERMHKLLVETGAITRTLDSVSSRLPALFDNAQARCLVENEIKRHMQEAIGKVGTEAKDLLKQRLRSNGAALIGGAAATVSFGPIAGMLAAGAAKAGLLDGVVERVIDDLTGELSSSKNLEAAADDVVKGLPATARDMLQDTQVRARLADMVEGAAAELVGAVDVRGIVEQELLARDDAELEALIDRVASSELVFIQVIGGVLGAVAGLALVWPVLIAPMALVFVGLWQFGRIAEKRYARKLARAQAKAALPAPAQRVEVPGLGLDPTPVDDDAPKRLSHVLNAAPLLSAQAEAIKA